MCAGEALQAISLFVAARRKERPFWLPRYHDSNVFTEEKLIGKRRYIHRNPVAHGQVGSAAE